MRTSLTDPLQIAEVVADPVRGRIGITFAPGKRDAHAMTGSWRRDLGLDLDAIAAWRAKAVVTLIEDREMQSLGIPNLGSEVIARGMAWIHLPIQDFDVPGPDFEARWPADGDRLRKILNAGENVLVHCKGGLGRAGMVSARLLVEFGEDPEIAIATVRAARPHAIETREQVNWVRRGARRRPL